MACNDHRDNSRPFENESQRRGYMISAPGPELYKPREADRSRCAKSRNQMLEQNPL
jgi:hypothetical protein